MNQRVEKLEGILEKQQSFLKQFLQSLQETKPSDQNWNVTIKSLQNNLEKITISNITDNSSEKTGTQKITSMSSANVQKELEDLRKKDEENQKIISSYDAKIKNLQSNLSNLTIQISKLTNHQSNLSLNSDENTLNSSELKIDNLDPKTALIELTKVVNNHSSQISAMLDSPAFSLPSDADVKIHEFDTDLRSIKTMLRNQADIWSEFEATIQVLVQFKDEANESSGSEDHNGSSENSKSSQSHSLQEQIRCLKYEVKKVRQEISAYSDQQESMSRDKGLDMPNRFNKINNQLGDLRKSINDSNNKIDKLSERVHTKNPIIIEKKEVTVEKVSDSLSCIKHELKKNINRINSLFSSFEQIRNEFSNLQARTKRNDETITQLRQAFDPTYEDEPSPQVGGNSNSNKNNNNNADSSPPSLKAQFKQIVEQAQSAQEKSTKHDESIESLTQRCNDIAKGMKAVIVMKQNLKSLQESNETLKKDVLQMKKQLQPQLQTQQQQQQQLQPLQQQQLQQQQQFQPQQQQQFQQQFQPQQQQQFQQQQFQPLQQQQLQQQQFQQLQQQQQQQPLPQIIITEREAKLFETGSNGEVVTPKFKDVKDVSEYVGKQAKQIHFLHNELHQVKVNQLKLERDLQDRIRDLPSPKHVVIEGGTNNSNNIHNNSNNLNSNNTNANNTSSANSISSLLQSRRERSSSNVSGLNLHLSGISSSNNNFKSADGIPLTGQSSSSQSRDHFFNWNRNNEGGNSNNETDADIDFDDLSPPSTPIIIKSTFESVDDISDAFKLVTHEQNRQKKVIERLVDAIKQAEIKNNKLKYLDKMMQEMRNRTSEQGDNILQLKTKQTTHDKTLQQLQKTVRYMETLNIPNELESIKKQIKNAGGGHQSSDMTSRNANRSPIRSHVSQPMQQFDDLRYQAPEQKSKKSSKTGASTSVRNTHSRKDQK